MIRLPHRYSHQLFNSVTRVEVRQEIQCHEICEYTLLMSENLYETSVHNNLLTTFKQYSFTPQRITQEFV